MTSPDTVLKVAILAADAAMKVLDQIQDHDQRNEAARATREMITDEKLRLRAAAQEMLERRKRGE